MTSADDIAEELQFFVEEKDEFDLEKTARLLASLSIPMDFPKTDFEVFSKLDGFNELRAIVKFKPFSTTSSAFVSTSLRSTETLKSNVN